jgi:hypothetical protein
MTPQRLQTLVTTAEAIVLWNLNPTAYAHMRRRLDRRELAELREAVAEANEELGVQDAPELQNQGKP